MNEYRKFGVSVGIVFMALFGLALPWILGKPLPHWPFFVGGPLLILGLAWPAVLKPLHWLWMKFAESMAWVNSRIVLVILFFLIFTPLAFLLKHLGRKDLLDLKREDQSKTYWRAAGPDLKPRWERPF